MLIVDPINIFYATGARNMMFFSMRVPARYLLILSEGLTILYEYPGCAHLAEECAAITEIRPAQGLCFISSGGDPQTGAMQFAAEISTAIAINAFDPTIDRLAVDRFPFAAIDALLSQGFSLTDADNVLQRARMQKLPMKIPYIRESMHRVETAVAQLKQTWNPDEPKPRSGRNTTTA